ncbi:MAG: class I SAM-dependent methyltransferase [Betaproteobacteria bacterium]|nr:class I SAM-dependent methyltransferase [Betaproteobacteria bacterium]
MNAPHPVTDAQAVRARMCARASACFRKADRFAFHFARHKLAADPLFTDVLLSGALRGRRQLVDLGCGQGLLSAWLLAAQSQRAEGPWPAGWPEPPAFERTRGVDLRAASIRRARAALGDHADFQVQDMRAADLNGADAVVILDVLHFIDYAEQQLLLERIRRSLPAGGVLVLRIANAGAALSYHLARLIDRMNDLVRDRRVFRFSCRSAQEWLQLLRHCGFDARALPRSSGSSFANTLLIARAP